MPCTLNTPDEVVLLKDKAAFAQQFNDIFLLLKNENVCAFKALNSSYQAINDTLILVNVDWQFFDDKNALFTEFSAVYHIVLENYHYKIFNVISQDISQSLTLEHSFSLKLQSII